MDLALVQLIGEADNGELARVDPIGDDAAALHEDTTGFDDMPGLELVDAGETFAAAGQDARCHLLDDVADVPGGQLEIVESAESRGDGSATVVAEDDDERYGQDFGSVFE